MPVHIPFMLAAGALYVAGKTAYDVIKKDVPVGDALSKNFGNVMTVARVATFTGLANSSTTVDIDKGHIKYNNHPRIDKT